MFEFFSHKVLSADNFFYFSKKNVNNLRINLSFFVEIYLETMEM